MKYKRKVALEAYREKLMFKLEEKEEKEEIYEHIGARNENVVTGTDDMRLDHQASTEPNVGKEPLNVGESSTPKQKGFFSRMLKSSSQWFTRSEINTAALEGEEEELDRMNDRIESDPDIDADFNEVDDDAPPEDDERSVDYDNDIYKNSFKVYQEFSKLKF